MFIGFQMHRILLLAGESRQRLKVLNNVKSLQNFKGKMAVNCNSVSSKFLKQKNFV